MKILVLAPAPFNRSPSQRFRFEHYSRSLINDGYRFFEKPFYRTSTWRVLYKKNHFFKKSFGIIDGFLRRTGLMFQLSKYQYVFIHREAAPIGPPIFEWVIAKVWRKKIIYDFDDAIWIKTSSESNPLASLIKCTWKVKKICRYSHIVSAGNSFLADFAGKYCKDVRIIPSVVNTKNLHNQIKNQTTDSLIIGWTGTFTNLKYLKIAAPALSSLQQKYPFTFLVISNKDPHLKEVEYKFISWKAETEIQDLLQFNIGIMPLEDTNIEKGKCAFKAIQYMSLGIPAVVSPVGTNCVVVKNNINGFWASNEQEWFEKLEKLIEDEQLRIEMGKQARKDIVENYSVESTRNLFVELFK